MNLIIKKITKLQAGSCNFCNADNYTKVTEVCGNHNGCLVVRFCNTCLNELLTPELAIAKEDNEWIRKGIGEWQDVCRGKDVEIAKLKERLTQC